MSHIFLRRFLLSIWLLFIVALHFAPLANGTSISCSQSECHLRLSARNGTECIEAYLSLSISVPYRCANFSSDCLATVAMPMLNDKNNATTEIYGQCGNSTASMLLQWSSGRIQLQFVFQQKSFYSSQIMTSIATYNFISRVTLKLDLRDSVFTNASIGPESSPIVTFVSSDRTFLFASPLGLTFKCQSPESIRLYKLTAEQQHQPLKFGIKVFKKSDIAVATFPKVRLDVFRSTAPAGGLLDGPFLCEADSNKQARSTTILVISGLLGVCMFVIVGGFLATRLNKNSGYSSVD